MKSLKYIISLIVITLTTQSTTACLEPIFNPDGYYIFRVNDQSGLKPDGYENVQAWKDLVFDSSIPDKDVVECVYRMTYDELFAIKIAEHYDGDNAFIKQLRFYTDRLDFLLLAKANEELRGTMVSRWYYPTMKVNSPMTLDQIVEQSLAYDKDSNLRDRYLLQAVRALTTLRNYDKCIEIWNNEASKLPKSNLMRRMIQPYVAGALFKTGKTQEAIAYFAEANDIQSLYHCLSTTQAKVTTVDRLATIYKYAPNSPSLAEELQSFVHNYEYSSNVYYDDNFTVTPELLAMRDLALRIGSENRSNNRPMWLYTAAYIEFLCDNLQEASRILTRAEALPATEYMEGSIKVLRMLLDAKNMATIPNYEQRLLGQLKWLDRKIINNIDSNVVKHTAFLYRQNVNISYYYWNDMQRRLLLAEVCPRMIENGKTTRALQLANMADNHLLNIVNRATIWELLSGRGIHDIKYVTLDEYRQCKGQKNDHDFCNAFFAAIDSLSADVAIAYVTRVRNPKDELDRFTNTRSYIGDNYLNDILGTHCLREMRYEEAEHYLSLVPSTKHKLNVEQYFTYDPFSYRRTRIADRTDYKYSFARQMASLEKAMNETLDVNRRARLAYRFAIGLKNSFYQCWALTQYGQGWTYKHIVYEADKEKEIAMQRFYRLIDNVLLTASDPELLALINYELCNFKEVAKKYPLTHYGKIVRGSCDNLRDYFTQR